MNDVLHGWDVVAPDGSAVGRLELNLDGGDMFWSECRFVPAPAFDAIAPLFIEELALLERGCLRTAALLTSTTSDS